MDIRRLADAEPFETADGSTIRLLLDTNNAPVEHQSLAEATLEPGASTVRHHHRLAEEFYYLVKGSGELEIDGECSTVHTGDAILIPPNAWHQITAAPDSPLCFLCCCAPPYSDDDTYFE